MLRITWQAGGDAPTLVLEGDLAGPWVDELRLAAEDAAAGTRTVELDLAGVRFAEPAGAELLHRLVARGFRVRRSSSFVDELLRSVRP